MSEGNVLCVSECRMSPFEKEFVVGSRYDVTLNDLGQFHVKGESGKWCGIWQPFFVESFSDAKNGVLGVSVERESNAD